MMGDSIHLETDVFEHREIKPHFINPCCFGEDFAAWLRRDLTERLGPGYKISESIQEDYGWGLRVRSERSTFWIAISYVGGGPTEGPAQWVVSAVCDRGLNVVKRLLPKSNTAELSQLRAQIQGAVESNPAIKILG